MPRACAQVQSAAQREGKAAEWWPEEAERKRRLKEAAERKATATEAGETDEVNDEAREDSSNGITDSSAQPATMGKQRMSAVLTMAFAVAVAVVAAMAAQAVLR